MTINFESKNYIHFDSKINFTEEVESYVKGYENNPKHNFLPLIYAEITFDKFLDITDGKLEDHIIRTNLSGQVKIIPVKTKIRPK